MQKNSKKLITMVMQQLHGNGHDHDQSSVLTTDNHEPKQHQCLCVCFKKKITTTPAAPLLVVQAELQNLLPTDHWWCPSLTVSKNEYYCSWYILVAAHQYQEVYHHQEH